MLPLKEVLEYLRTGDHPNTPWMPEGEELLPGQWLTLSWNLRGARTFSRSDRTWAIPVFNFDGGKKFAAVLEKRGGTWYSWVHLLSGGGKRDAKRYLALVRLRSPEGEPRPTYRTSVLPPDCPKDKIFRRRRTFSLSNEAAREHITTEGLLEHRREKGYDYCLPIDYQIVKVK